MLDRGGQQNAVGQTGDKRPLLFYMTNSYIGFQPRHRNVGQ
jgi:hypothetical protein